MSIAILFAAVTFCSASQAGQQPLSSLDDYLQTQLASYELLQPVKLISRRSAGQRDPNEHLQFSAFHRQFHLVLKPSRARHTQLLQQPLKATVVEGDDGEIRQSVQYDIAELLSDFYTGYIDDDPGSRVSGYRDADRLHLTVHESDSKVLNIEPLSLLTGNLSEHRLLAYYDSSINSINSSQYRCGLSDTATEGAPIGVPAARNRQRRWTTNGTETDWASLVCTMHLVADHTLVDHIGSVGYALKFLIKAVDDVNEIFLATQFVASDGETFSRIGFQLSDLTAMKVPTVVSSADFQHFNEIPNPTTHVTSGRLLEAFGDQGQNGLTLTRHCVSHLATYRHLDGRVLGLAYEGNKYGGICTNPTMSIYGRGRPIARNIGLTTFRNRDGEPVLSRRASLVMAHELSHNFGSPHDPSASRECSPELHEGGQFLMHDRAVSGNRINHNVLSPCSRRRIGNLIQSKLKWSSCLIRPSCQVCGNSRREPGEECDAGPEGDVCCDAHCRLRPGANCSSSNSACCQNCHLAVAGTVCRCALPLQLCRSDAVCDGVNDVCPTSGAHLSDGTVCLTGAGVCLGGVCRTLCQVAGLRDCRCQGLSESCLVCCTGAVGNTSHGGCSVHRRADGTQVRWPGCVSFEPGISGGMTARLFRLARRTERSSLITAMKHTMALVTIALSLLIGVPVCLIIEFNMHPYDVVDEDDEEMART